MSRCPVKRKSDFMAVFSVRPKFISEPFIRKLLFFLTLSDIIPQNP
jgi:hypothetical protein